MRGSVVCAHLHSHGSRRLSRTAQDPRLAGGRQSADTSGVRIGREVQDDTKLVTRIDIDGILTHHRDDVPSQNDALHLISRAQFPHELALLVVVNLDLVQASGRVITRGDHRKDVGLEEHRSQDDRPPPKCSKSFPSVHLTHRRRSVDPKTSRRTTHEARKILVEGVGEQIDVSRGACSTHRASLLVSRCLLCHWHPVWGNETNLATLRDNNLACAAATT
mmetsp:Transcript_60851/g.161632  ORF Transcript_60851/g.161632 Transcript_60851/m.161632 type:complete len:220 (+) Transcript_60851:849-1508(+)